MSKPTAAVLVALIVSAFATATIIAVFAPHGGYPPPKIALPGQPPEVNDAFTRMLDLQERTFAWTDADWHYAYELAAAGPSLGTRLQAIYLAGDQAGCERCLTPERRTLWEPALRRWLAAPEEHLRAAALKVAYQFRLEGVDLSRDPSPVVQWIWGMTYGRPQ